MKSFILSSILLSIGSSSFSQKNLPNTFAYADSLPVINLKNEPRFYLNIHGGYAVSLGTTFKFYPDNVTSISVTQLNGAPPVREIDYKQNTKGLGNGARAGIGFSYIINDFINAGMDIDYFHSSISKTKDSSYHSSRINNSNGTIREVNYDEQSKISYEASVLTFCPNISLKAIVRPKFFIYNKLGAIIVISPSSTQHENVNGYSHNGVPGSYKDSSISKQKTYDWGIQKPAFGFMGAIGGQVKVKEKIRAFAEFQFTHIIFKPINRTVATYKINSHDMMSTLSESEKEVIYKKSYKSEDVNRNPNMPTVAIYQKIPITYAGLQAGIIYNF